jgi:hypothetical protein
VIKQEFQTGTLNTYNLHLMKSFHYDESVFTIDQIFYRWHSTVRRYRQFDPSEIMLVSLFGSDAQWKGTANLNRQLLSTKCRESLKQLPQSDHRCCCLEAASPEMALGGCGHLLRTPRGGDPSLPDRALTSFAASGKYMAKLCLSLAETSETISGPGFEFRPGPHCATSYSSHMHTSC